MTYSYLYTKYYTDCVQAQARNPPALAELTAALSELATEPFHNPRLQTHRMHRAQGETYVSYVGSGGRRLIWRLLGRTIVLLLFGEHDAVERRAERLRLDIDTEEDRVRVIDADPADGQPVAYEERRRREGTLLMAWNDGDLAAFGFEPQELGVLRRLDDEADLLALERRMRPEAFRRACNLVEHGHPDGAETPVDLAAARAAEQAPAFVVDGVDSMEAHEREEALERALHRPGSREEFAPVNADALASVLGKPIEDWMVFLHPDQVRLTERPFAGPARVRGAAGTGKTVVALHRARHLADTYDGKVLFTTYVRNLPPVFEELYRRLAPSTAGRVEFINLHKWAWRFLARCGDPPATDLGAADGAFATAWSRTVTPDGYIRRRGYGRAYYREELDWIIKGRGLTSLDDYLGLERTGRGSPLTGQHRREVWALYEEYQRLLAHRGVVDFNDVLARALELVRDGRLGEPYAAVIVDEAQDLTEVGVRLAYELAGRDKRDGLFLVGDGQQAVYPGGYSLSSVGIDVPGRSAVLRVNYRNTRAILEAAGRLVEDRPFDDLDEQPADGRRDVDCLRNGEPPAYGHFDSAEDHHLALVAAIDEAARAPGCGPGDLAVLLPTNKLVDACSRRITELGYRTIKLERYNGKPSEEVKVGTYQRGKGLEFKWVFLPHLDPETLGECKRFNEDDDTYAERLELLRRRLFVSMTRARDQLWLGWVGRPSMLLRLPATVATA